MLRTGRWGTRRGEPRGGAGGRGCVYAPQRRADDTPGEGGGRGPAGRGEGVHRRARNKEYRASLCCVGNGMTMQEGEERKRRRVYGGPVPPPRNPGGACHEASPPQRDSPRECIPGGRRAHRRPGPRRRPAPRFRGPRGRRTTGTGGAGAPRRMVERGPTGSPCPPPTGGWGSKGNLRWFEPTQGWREAERPGSENKFSDCGGPGAAAAAVEGKLQGDRGDGGKPPGGWGRTWAQPARERGRDDRCGAESHIGVQCLVTKLLKFVCIPELRGFRKHT